MEVRRARTEVISRAVWIVQGHSTRSVKRLLGGGYSLSQGRKAKSRDELRLPEKIALLLLAQSVYGSDFLEFRRSDGGGRKRFRGDSLRRTRTAITFAVENLRTKLFLIVEEYASLGTPPVSRINAVAVLHDPLLPMDESVNPASHFALLNRAVYVAIVKLRVSLVR